MAAGPVELALILLSLLVVASVVTWPVLVLVRNQRQMLDNQRELLELMRRDE